MGWVIDVAVAVILLVVVAVNLVLGFKKCGMNNAFSLGNIVISGTIAYFVGGVAAKALVPGGTEGGAVDGLASLLVSVAIFLILYFILSIIFGIVKIPLRKVNVDSKAPKIIGRVVSCLIGVALYLFFLWFVLALMYLAFAVVKKLGINDLAMFDSSFFYANNPLRSIVDGKLDMIVNLIKGAGIA